MWEHRHLTTLWASTACYRDTFTIFLLVIVYIGNRQLIYLISNILYPDIICSILFWFVILVPNLRGTKQKTLPCQRIPSPGIRRRVTYCFYLQDQRISQAILPTANSLEETTAINIRNCVLKQNIDVRFEVLTAVVMKNSIFWDI
jgi:hypothetical protein